MEKIKTNGESPEAEEIPKLEAGCPTPAEFSKLISAGEELQKTKPVENDLAKGEESFFESERKKAELRSFNQDVDQRRSFANGIFCLIAGWLVAIFVVILLSGFLSERVTIKFILYGSAWVFTPQFKLSDAVVLALIGGTTVNVLGILILVVQYLFPKKGN